MEKKINVEFLVNIFVMKRLELYSNYLYQICYVAVFGYIKRIDFSSIFFITQNVEYLPSTQTHKIPVFSKTAQKILMTFFSKEAKQNVLTKKVTISLIKLVS